MSHKSDFYYQHIDALRAFAVLSVVIFHFDHEYLPGGFVGVDIFFVVSGFLISSQLYKSIFERTFSLKDFYVRRIKRIMPASFSVILATLLLAQVFFLPEDTLSTAKSGIWSLFSLSNLYFWKFQDSGYFATASYTLPLLHYWSLGVEEQFYLIWPIFLLMVFNQLNRWFFLSLLITVVLVSILLAEIFIIEHHSFVYYMLPTRAGELLIGGLFAALIHYRAIPALSSKNADLLFIFSVLGIMVSVIFIEPTMAFPGWLCLLPTLSAAGFIWSGLAQSKLVNVVCHPMLLWVGKISFSVYLVHWPVMAFYRYGYGELSILGEGVLFILIFVLAWFNWKYVEERFRYSNITFSGALLRRLLLPIAVLAFYSLYLIHTQGYGFRVFNPVIKQQIESLQNKAVAPIQYEYVCQYWRIEIKHLRDENCVVGSGVDRKILLWGDSNAAHYIGLLGTISSNQGWSFRNISHAGCPPIFYDISVYVALSRRNDCRESIDLVRAELAKYNTIVVSAAFDSYMLKSENFLIQFQDTVLTLAKNGKSIMIIGKAPVFSNFDRHCLSKSLLYPSSTCEVTRLSNYETVLHINRQLRAYARKHRNITYIDFNDLICNPICSPFIDNEPIYFDGSHIEISASWRLGEIFMRKDSPTLDVIEEVINGG